VYILGRHFSNDYRRNREPGATIVKLCAAAETGWKSAAA
jgi:hypothetical protein